MADNPRERNFVEIEDELNAALGRIGERTTSQYETTVDEKIAAITVQDLLQQLRIDEFERMYITTAAQSSSPTNEQLPDDKIEQVKTLAEYQLEQMDGNEEISEDGQTKLKAASNFYLIPHTVNQRYSVGDVEQTRTIDLYTVNDVEGYSLYTIIDNQNISITSSFRDRIQKYLEQTYPDEIKSGNLKVDEVIDHFTPKTPEEMYDMLGNENIISMRFLSERIDEFVVTKGIEIPQDRTVVYPTQRVDAEPKSRELKDDRIKEADLKGYDDLSEEENAGTKPESEQGLETDEGETLEEPDDRDDKVRDGASIRLTEDLEKEPEEPVESYVEKIARLNHVKPAVVNTRVVENFEKVEEDTGIPLKGRYPRGEVIAVRIPYKLGYRTFLVEKSTGLTIDGKGRMDRHGGRLYDFDEIEDYFRFKLRDGHDGGEGGKPLRYDEGRDYTTYIDEHGDVKEQKFVNNGKKQDMLREERERYLAEVEEVDRQLADAIEDYQKAATRENYEKVRDLVKKKVEIDNKYNALDEQREITEQTKENTEEAIHRDLDDDDDWFPGPGPRFFR